MNDPKLIGQICAYSTCERSVIPGTFHCSETCKMLDVAEFREELESILTILQATKE